MLTAGTINSEGVCEPTHETYYGRMVYGQSYQSCLNVLYRDRLNNLLEGQAFQICLKKYEHVLAGCQLIES